VKEEKIKIRTKQLTRFANWLKDDPVFYACLKAIKVSIFTFPF